MYTDIHCHLLPGVDDGVKTWEDSLACLKMAAGERISTICVTPHIWADKYPNTPAGLEAAFWAWRERVEASGLGLQVHLGSEVYYPSDLAEDWAAGKFRAMGPVGRYLLVELPLLVCPQGLEKGFYELRLKGVEPLLAHPERYPWAHRDRSRLGPLAHAGVPFQVTTHSVAGIFGAEIQRSSFALLEMGWVSVLASDAHSPTGRAPMFREAVRVVANRYGHEAARLLAVENPRRVLRGESLLPVTCERRKRGFFS
jgi:protein-tyrosine phosphatase